MSDGDVTILGGAIEGQPLTLHQNCVYPVIRIEISDDYDSYLDGGFEFWLTGKEKELDVTPLFDVSGSVYLDEPTTKILTFALTSTHTDQDPIFNGLYQVMVKNAAGDNVRIAVTGKLTIERTLKAV